MAEVFVERLRKGTSRESQCRYIGIQGGVECLSAAEEGVVDWAKVGVTGKRRRIKYDGVCSFDNKAVIWLVGSVVGATTAVDMSKR